MQEQAIQPATSAKKSKKQLIWGLVCLLGPTVLIVISILLYAVVNFITGASATPASGNEATSADLFGEPSPVQAVFNVVLFLIGAFSVAAWLPGLIAGIVLLATRK